MSKQETGPCEVHAKIADGLSLAKGVAELFEGRSVAPSSNGVVRRWTQRGYDQARGAQKALACLETPGMTMEQVFALIHEETMREEDITAETQPQQRSLAG